MARNREDIVVVALAAAGPSAAFDPIRLQTLLFLIDQVVSERVGGPFFRFAPYHYGPFDQGIYDVIRAMVAAGDARVDASGPYPRHSLTQAGRRRGEAALASFPAPVASYFRRVARWMLLTPYRRMLAAIWREYPEMALNSIHVKRAASGAGPGRHGGQTCSATIRMSGGGRDASSEGTVVSSWRWGRRGIGQPTTGFPGGWRQGGVCPAASMGDGRILGTLAPGRAVLPRIERFRGVRRSRHR